MSGVHTGVFELRLGATRPVVMKNTVCRARYQRGSRTAKFQDNRPRFWHRPFPHSCDKWGRNYLPGNSQELVFWELVLHDEGIAISEGTLKTRLKQWNVQLSNVGLIPEVLTAISDLSHTTTLTDTEIADQPNTEADHQMHAITKCAIFPTQTNNL